MARLSPSLHFARFVTQPEVKFHVFGRLKRGAYRKIYYDLHIGSHVDSIKKIKKNLSYTL